MKKFILSFMVTVCSLGCFCGLTACGKNPETPNDTGKVTAAEWDELLGNAQNFTLRVYDSQTLDEVAAIYADKDKFMNATADGKQIVTKEGNEYFMYGYNNSDAEWVKMKFDETEYTAQVAMSLQYCSFLRGQFSMFRYSEADDATSTDLAPLYHCDSLTLALQGVDSLLEDITVTFKNGAPYEISYRVVMGEGIDRSAVPYRLTDFGTTVIELPVDYTDQTDITA